MSEVKEQEEKLFKVKASTNPTNLAGFIAKSIQEGTDNLELSAIGASAVNQMIKGCIISRKYCSVHGYDLAVVPCFRDIMVGSESRTAIVVIIKRL